MRQDANELQSFKALRLNMGSLAMSWKPGCWKARLGSAARARRRNLRVSTCSGSTWAARLRSPAQPHFTKTDVLDSFGVFPERPSLAHRGQSLTELGTLYTRAARQGELYCAGRVRQPTLGSYSDKAVERWGQPEAISRGSFPGGGASNRSSAGPTSPPGRFCHQRPWATGMGAEDVRRFRKMALTGKLRNASLLAL